MKEESESTDENDIQDLTFEHLDSLTYLDCVINEAVRYSSPADGTVRTMLVTGSMIRHFYPERFLHEHKTHHLCALLPLGGSHLTRLMIIYLSALVFVLNLLEM